MLKHFQTNVFNNLNGVQEIENQTDSRTFFTASKHFSKFMIFSCNQTDISCKNAKTLHRYYSYRNSAIICKCLFVATKYCGMSSSHASCCRIISSLEWSSTYNSKRQEIKETKLFRMYIMWDHDLCSFRD